MIATVDNPSNAAEWALAEMVNRLASLLPVLPQLKFWASYATGATFYSFWSPKPLYKSVIVNYIEIDTESMVLGVHTCYIERL